MQLTLQKLFHEFMPTLMLFVKISTSHCIKSKYSLVQEYIEGSLKSSIVSLLIAILYNL